MTAACKTITAPPPDEDIDDLIFGTAEPTHSDR